MQHYVLADLRDNHPRLSDSDVQHAVRVMRMRAGESFVGIWAGRRWPCRVTAVDPFAAECTPAPLPSNEPAVFVTAVLAVSKAGALESSVQKVVEAGVGSIVLLNAHRSPPWRVNVVRLQRIAKEAAEQAHRDYVPSITGPFDLAGALQQVSVPGVLFDVAAGLTLCQTALPPAERLVFAVGPEGGWDGGELAAFSAAGFVACRLSATVLRAETAAAVAAYELCWNLSKRS